MPVDTILERERLTVETNNEEPEALATIALRHIARDESIKAYVQKDRLLHQVLLRAARRFIGGETLVECVETAKAMNAEGFAVTIDYMGESTRDEEAAREATKEFLEVVREVWVRGLNSSVSLDLSHVGLVVDRELAFENATLLARAAWEAGLEVMISAEGSERTVDVLETHRRLCEDHDNVGITLQAYLYRTPQDLREALDRPGRIRLVKGAYEEPRRLAWPRGARVDVAYRKIAEELLASGHACSISTHDSYLLERAHGYVSVNNLALEPIEFEKLKGVEPDRLRTMRDRGYRTRTYLPYGEEWYLYLCHRLAEYPPNIYRAVYDSVGFDGLNPAAESNL